MNPFVCDSSGRFVTDVTWIGGELWDVSWENDESSLWRINPETGEVLEQLDMPEGVGVSGLEATGDTFYCGGGRTGKIRAVRRPGR